ncbi:gamma-glutamylcyclotransferase family protein [Actinokineospora sp. HUAS TT18]|uniref:gamma-glutamylcyclotransferase family protein n=1 Tax=Actinokineospora sp. HUAS TT18 TaxID=3447451 RepID=UPI003F520903
MFVDADYPALPYPGGCPPFSYVHDEGTGWPLDGLDVDRWLRDRGAPVQAERVPVLAYGSNACPSKLSWLRSELGMSGPVVVLRAKCTGLAAVWAAGLRSVDSSRPVVLAALPGVEEHAVLLVTPEQVRALDACEGRGTRHHLAFVRTGEVTLAAGGRLDGVLAYVGATESRRPLLVDGAMVRSLEPPRPGVAGSSDGLVYDVLAGDPVPDAYPGSLFVYGTLQPGASAWDVLAGGTVGTPRRARIAGTLFDTGRGYPALTIGAGPGVDGWLVELAGPQVLAAADAYEGGEYSRVRAVLDDGTLCWTYVWIGPHAGLVPMAAAWPSGSPMG